MSTLNYFFKQTKIYLGLTAALAVGALLMPAQHADAVLYTFDFQTPAGNVGNTHTYTNNSASIVGKGFTLGFLFNTTADLYDKTSGGAESGLGIASDPTGDNEITKTTFVQLDLNAILALSPTNLVMKIGSAQTGEGFQIFGTNTAGGSMSNLTGATLLASGSGGDLVTVSSFLQNPFNFRYIDVTATGITNANILINSVTFNGNTVGVPEPTTMLLLGSGLLMGLRRKLARS